LSQPARSSLPGPARRASGLADSRLLRSAGRLGLIARGVFYLLLAGLAGSLVLGPPGGQAQANTNGALQAIASTSGGRILLAGAVLGLTGYGLARLAGSVTDRQPGRLRRLSTAGQGLGYLAAAWLTGSFLLGEQAVGSEQQRERTAGLVLGLPGGPLLVTAAGLAVLGVCCWQLVVAARGHFADTLDAHGTGRTKRRLIMSIARVGIAARAIAYLPVAVFLVLAGVRHSPQQAGSLDVVLLELARTGLGRVLVLLVAAGFVIFAAYSFIEARYRRVVSGA
jgi:hypothetical protein